MGAALCDVNDVMALIPGTASADARNQLIILVAHVSDLARRYCSREFLTASLTEYYRGNGGTTLVLNNWPVQSITVVSINNNVVPPAAMDANGVYVVNSSGYGITGSEKNILTLFGCLRFSMGASKNVCVQYSAGYGTIGSSKTLPGDLYYALVQECAWRFQELKRLGQNSEHFGEESIGYVVKEISPVTKMILDKYRSVAFGN